jgi:hypothetical protein
MLWTFPCAFLPPSIELMYSILPLTINISDDFHHVLTNFYKIFLTSKKEWCVLKQNYVQNDSSKTFCLAILVGVGQ